MVKCLTVPCCGVKVPKNTRCRRPTGKTGNLISKHTGHVWVGSPTDLWQKCLKKSLDISQVMSSWRGALLEMREGEKTRIWVPASRPSELEFGKLSERGLLGQVNKRRLHLTYEIGLKDVEILHNEFSQLLSQPRSICFFSGKLIHPVTHCVMDILPVATTPCSGKLGSYTCFFS